MERLRQIGAIRIPRSARLVPLTLPILAVLASSCMGSSSHTALSPAQAQAKLMGLDHIDAVVSTKPKWTFCSQREHPSDRIPLRYKVVGNDTRMPTDPPDQSGLLGTLVLQTTAGAKTCYRWLRSRPPTASINGKLVKPKGKPFGHYTLVYKQSAPGLEFPTVVYDLVILNGHTVVYGESYNAKNATMTESDAVTLRDLIGN